jgi:hypothetical protein
MSNILMVKLMDSGTALFRADNPEAAKARLVDVLKAYGSVSEAGGHLVLDFSTWRYHQFIEARLEETSIPGTWAAVLRTGDAPKLPFDFPSGKAVSITKDILKALGE